MDLAHTHSTHVDRHTDEGVDLSTFGYCKTWQSVPILGYCVICGSKQKLCWHCFRLNSNNCCCCCCWAHMLVFPFAARVHSGCWRPSHPGTWTAMGHLAGRSSAPSARWAAETQHAHNAHRDAIVAFKNSACGTARTACSRGSDASGSGYLPYHCNGHAAAVQVTTGGAQPTKCPHPLKTWPAQLLCPSAMY